MTQRSCELWPIQEESLFRGWLDTKIFWSESVYTTSTWQKIVYVEGNSKIFISSYDTEISRDSVTARFREVLLPLVDQANEKVKKKQQLLLSIIESADPTSCDVINFLKSPEFLPYKFIIMEKLDAEMSFFGENGGYENIGIHPEFLLTAESESIANILDHELIHMIDRRGRISDLLIPRYLPTLTYLQGVIKHDTARSYRISNEELLARCVIYWEIPKEKLLSDNEFWNLVIDICIDDILVHEQMKKVFDIGGTEIQRNTVKDILEKTERYDQLLLLIKALNIS